MFSLRGNVLFICVSCFILNKMSSAESITNFFPDVRGNLSRVTWAHAVNNSTYLNSTLYNGKIKMIEADIVLGTLTTNSSGTIPIMAHPPANSSDLSLENFLETITNFNNNIASNGDNTTDSSNNGTTNIPVPNNSTNDNSTSNSNSTSDANVAGNATGTNNTVAEGINSSDPNITDVNTGTNEALNTSTGTNTADTNTTGTNNTVPSGVISTNPNGTNLPNITGIDNGTSGAVNNSNGASGTNTNFNSTTPNNANNTISANSTVPVNTARVANTTDNISNTTNSPTKKGVKLDFKTIQAFNGSIHIINKYSNASFPIWLNADILPGPGNSTFLPVNATEFLGQAQEFGKVTLSLGWTTTVEAGTGSYTDKQIDEMIDIIKKNNITNEITFAVRSALAAESLPQMKKLLEGIKDSTLTLWSGETDKVNVTNLRTLIANTGSDKIFIDVPDHLMKELNLANLPTIPSSAALVSKMSGIASLLTLLIVVFA